uniref:Uncharacterized protein n=1 Tax=Arundo donax TaxID=35708 RepID=A0A0A8ZQF2_ARUDO
MRAVRAMRCFELALCSGGEPTGAPPPRRSPPACSIRCGNSILLLCREPPRLSRQWYTVGSS